VKKILLISPHYPPSNLAAVHRTRLFAQHLPSFGWEPIILTVHEDYYEETLDWNLVKLLPQNQRIEKVSALPVTKPRLVGDIGLRGFYQLRKRALQLIKTEKIDFVLILIPSFYVSLIGPYLHRKTGVRYGIDYIDPWVHVFPGSDKTFSRHWWSTKLAQWLEPKAVKYASLITGCAEGYYEGVVKRNPHLLKRTVFGAMPYGGEAKDHELVPSLHLKPYLFQKNYKLQFVYAGALLPKAYSVLSAVFEAVAENRELFAETEFHFIGTGKAANDATSFTVRPIAEKFGLWQQIVFEYPKRIPYLDVLIHLNSAGAVFILGSTEPHYTPSKTYQAVLSKKPIMALLHSASSAVSVLNETGAGMVFSFNGAEGIPQVKDSFASFFQSFQRFYQNFQPDAVKMNAFEMYSAKSVTQQLSLLLEKAVEERSYER
jgi:hypothetical protein